MQLRCVPLGFDFWYKVHVMAFRADLQPGIQVLVRTADADSQSELCGVIWGIGRMKLHTVQQGNVEFVGNPYRTIRIASRPPPVRKCVTTKGTSAMRVISASQVRASFPCIYGRWCGRCSPVRLCAILCGCVFPCAALRFSVAAMLKRVHATARTSGLRGTGVDVPLHNFRGMS